MAAVGFALGLIMIGSSMGRQMDDLARRAMQCVANGQSVSQCEVILNVVKKE